MEILNMRKRTNDPSVKSDICKLALAILLCGTPAGVALASESGVLFEHSNMKEVNLTGLRVWLGPPVQVTAQKGWAMNWAPADKPLGSETVVDFHETHGPSGVHLCPF